MFEMKSYEVGERLNHDPRWICPLMENGSAQAEVSQQAYLVQRFAVG